MKRQWILSFWGGVETVGQDAATVQRKACGGRARFALPHQHTFAERPRRDRSRRLFANPNSCGRS